jgi:hypothetical protein
MHNSVNDVIVSAPTWSLKAITLGLLLSLVLVVPSLAFYFGLASSMALGASVMSIIVIGVCTKLRAARPYQIWVGRISSCVLILLVLIVISLHFVIATFILPVDLERATQSLVPLALILLAGYGMGGVLLTVRDTAIDRAVYLCFALMCGVGLLAASGFVPTGSEIYFKPVFPYTEPSHFALAFLPLLLFGCVSLTGSTKLVLLVSGLAMGWALESLTLLAGWLMIALICLRNRAILFLLVILVLVGAQLDISYYLDRLDFGNNTKNLSTLVYLQGWQLITESLTLSNVWGLGFQQLGVHGSNVIAADEIFSILGGNSNLLDGGFTFAKIVSEFGVLSLPLMVLYIAFVLNAARHLRWKSLRASKEVSAITLAQCVVVCFIIELFVRGSGYFSGTTLLLAASVTTLSLRPWAPLVNVGARRWRRRFVSGAINKI